MASGIYTITNLIDNKMYLGYTKSFESRSRQHFSELNRGNHPNIHLQRAYNKHGKENFKFEILEECSEYFLASSEHYWATILKVNDPRFGYNTKPTHPEGCSRHSLESIKKGVETWKSRGSVRKSWRMTDEQRANVSRSKMGSANPRFGVPHSENHKNHISKIMKEKGTWRKAADATKIPILQMLDDGTVVKEWPSATDAARYYGSRPTCIRRVITGDRVHYKGFRWKYKNK